MSSTPKIHAHPLQTYVATSPLSLSNFTSAQASTLDVAASDEFELGYAWRAASTSNLAVERGCSRTHTGRGRWGRRAARLPAVVGGIAGFAVPLTVGIANLVRTPSVLNPSGEQNVGVAASALLGGITLGPAVGAVVGALVGSVCCRAPLPWQPAP